MHIVDAHHHLQDMNTYDYPWLLSSSETALEGDIKPIRANYLVDDYLTDILPYTVTKSVHIENGMDGAKSLLETRWLDHIGTTTGFPTAIVAFVDLFSEDAHQKIDEHCAYVRMRGIRQTLTWHSDFNLSTACRGLMEARQWRCGFSALAARDLSFELQIFSHQAEEAHSLAKDFPDTRIVLTHLGMPIDRSREGIERWIDSLRLLAITDNMYIKLSGFRLGARNYTLHESMPLVLQAIEIFGSSRCMFGSNLPVERLFSAGQEPFDALALLSKQLNESEMSDILHGSAETFYRI